MSQFHEASLQDQHNAIRSIIDAALDNRAKCDLVKVIAVYPDEKKLDAIPLVMRRDIQNNPIENAVIYGISFARLQGGNSAIVIDPVVGDIGFIGCCDRDVSNVVASKKSSLPASYRKDSYSDAIYFGTVLGEEPTQFIRLNADGITIISQSKVTINASELDVECESTFKALATFEQGAVINNSAAINGGLTIDDNEYNSHAHSGVESGNSTTGGVV